MLPGTLTVVRLTERHAPCRSGWKNWRAYCQEAFGEEVRICPWGRHSERECEYHASMPATFLQTHIDVYLHAQSKGKVISLGVLEKDIYFADVAAGRATDYAEAFRGADAVIIATSGVPKIVPWSLVKAS